MLKSIVLFLVLNVSNLSVFLSFGSYSIYNKGEAL